MTKKITRVVALALVIALACITLASCGKTLSGTYTAGGSVLGTGATTTYKFSGSKVTLTVEGSLLGMSSSETFEGTYKITESDDGSMKISFDFGDEDAKEYSTSFNFKEDKDAGTITIGLITYTKK